ncbi:MAG: phosphatase PAP2 family protein [Gammaproteobacteria bacterium]|nr:phosphatase PAP2 family protein [Gammaproteobacteria bacterium]MDX2488496.1 phosphatase PAP2 family protein [Gammaproteobacteria bacterium]
MKNIKQSLEKNHLIEYAIEISLVLLSLGLFGFFKLTEEVVEGDTRGFDQSVLLWFRNKADLSDPIGPQWLEVVVRDITALGGLVILGLLTIAACGYLWLTQRHKLALFVAVSIPAGALLNTLLKEYFTRPRPDIVPHGTGAALSSFPSGHAMMSAVVFLTLGALLSLSTENTRIKIYILFWSVFLTVIVGISRVYLGVHWPTDIIAGWIAGGTWAVLCLLVGHWLLRTQREG